MPVDPECICGEINSRNCPIHGGGPRAPQRVYEDGPEFRTRTRFPRVQGRCPACKKSTLFVGSGGYITCGRLDCPDPVAAHDLLDGRAERLEAVAEAADGIRSAEFERLERALLALEADDAVTRLPVQPAPERGV